MERQLDAEARSAAGGSDRGAKGVRVRARRAHPRRSMATREWKPSSWPTAAICPAAWWSWRSASARAPLSPRSAACASARGIIVDDADADFGPGVFAIGECAEHRGICYGLVEPCYEQAKRSPPLHPRSGDRRATRARCWRPISRFRACPSSRCRRFRGERAPRRIVVRDAGQRPLPQACRCATDGSPARCWSAIRAMRIWYADLDPLWRSRCCLPRRARVSARRTRRRRDERPGFLRRTEALPGGLRFRACRLRARRRASSRWRAWRALLQRQPDPMPRTSPPWRASRPRARSSRRRRRPSATSIPSMPMRASRRESANGQYPKGADNFRWRYHGLFYVAPAQNCLHVPPAHPQRHPDALAARGRGRRSPSAMAKAMRMSRRAPTCRCARSPPSTPSP